MNFDTLFDPKVVAVVGARPEPDRVGFALMDNLLQGGPRTIIPVTEEFPNIFGIPAKKSIGEIEGTIDLAVIAVKAAAVPQAIRDAVAKGAKAAVVISAGFKEAGEEGKKLEEEISAIAKESGIALLGPNCLGVIDTATDLNVSFAPQMPLPGCIALLSQSGAIGTAFLDWAHMEGVGISKFISLGNEAGFSEVAMLEHLGSDENTDAILMYLEHVSDGPRLLELLRAITPEKPVIVLRAGRSSRGASAVASHTGSLAPADATFTAALRQAGAAPVESLRELFNIAKLLSLGIRSPLSRLAIVTNGGGPSVNASDLIELSRTLSLVDFDEETKTALRAVLPSMAAVGNPVDVIGDARRKRYDDAFAILVKKPDIDAILAIVTPQMMTPSEDIAESIIEWGTKKPIIPVFMGGDSARPGVETLKAAGLVSFETPPDAIEALDAIGKRKKQIPPKAHAASPSALSPVTFSATRTLLESCGLAVSGNFITDRAMLRDAWGALGGAKAALKAFSFGAVHKTEAKAIRLHLSSLEEAERAWDEISANIQGVAPGASIEGMLLQSMVEGREVIVGGKRDRTFGPIVLFGLGGIFVELMKDVAMRVAPVSREEALLMLEDIEGRAYLNEFRRMAAIEKGKLADIIASVSRLLAEHPEIEEIDLNPVIATPDAAHIVDVRVMRKE
jgi:acetyltransferase